MTEREPSSGMTKNEYERIMRQIHRDEGICTRHVHVQRNPLSASHCDQCLDYFRSRYTPKGTGHGRTAIPRGTA
jgi:hypothetical protein